VRDNAVAERNNFREPTAIWKSVLATEHAKAAPVHPVFRPQASAILGIIKVCKTVDAAFKASIPS